MKPVLWILVITMSAANSYLLAAAYGWSAAIISWPTAFLVGAGGAFLSKEFV